MAGFDSPTGGWVSLPADILRHERQQRTTIVALHGRDLPAPTLKEILKQAGLSEDEFKELL